MLFDTMQPDEWLCCKSDRSLKSELDWRWSFRACQRTRCCAAAIKRNLVFRPVHSQLQATSSNACWFGWQQDDVTVILLKQKQTTQKVRRDGVVRGEQPWDVRPSAAWEVPELCESSSFSSVMQALVGESCFLRSFLEKFSFVWRKMLHADFGLS